MAWLVVYWLRFPHNYTISDPWLYAYHAHLVAAGTFFKTLSVPNVFAQRFGVLLPVALVYALFGVTPETTALVPLLAGLTILFVIWRVLPKAAALPGVICTLTCVPFLRGTTELFPDLIASALMMISVLMLSRRLDAPDSRSAQLLRAGIGVLAWFAAVLAKETACWALPVWAGALLVDAWRRRGPVLKWFHAPALLFGGLLSLGYLWFCAHFFGDALSRLHGIEELTGRHTWAIHKPAQLATRLTSGAAHFFWDEYGLLLVAAVPGLLLLPDKLRIWAFYTATTVLCYWFGSTSLSSYQPLPTSWRMTLPCAPGFCIAAGYSFYWVACRVGRWLWAPLYPLLLVSTSALAVLIMGPKVIAEQRTWRIFPDLDAMALVKREIQSHPAVHYLLISAEQRTGEFAAAYFGFSPPANVTLVYVGVLDAELLARADAALLIVDPRHARHDRNLSYAPQVRALRLPPLFHRGNVWVFKADDLARLGALRARRQ